MKEDGWFVESVADEGLLVLSLVHVHVLVTQDTVGPVVVVLRFHNYFSTTE